MNIKTQTIYKVNGLNFYHMKTKIFVVLVMMINQFIVGGEEIKNFCLTNHTKIQK